MHHTATGGRWHDHHHDAQGPPVAIASASPTVGDAPLAVSFDSAGSLPGAGTGLTYTWDFGDGSPTASGPTASHVYDTVGIYSAELTMTSTAGTSTSSGITITVNQDPNPKFYVRPGGSTGPDCGPILDPCSSIVEAQANAVANGIGIVRVAGGTYNAPITLASNMVISGGWTQDFSDFGPSEVTTVFGNGTTPAVTVNGVTNSTVSGISAQGVSRTSGDAVGILVTGGSSGVAIGDNEAPETFVGGGVGPNPTGLLVTGGSLVNVVNANINSGTPAGSGVSAYGVRALGLSVVNVTLSEVTAQPGTDGVTHPRRSRLRPPRAAQEPTAATPVARAAPARAATAVAAPRWPAAAAATAVSSRATRSRGAAGEAERAAGAPEPAATGCFFGCGDAPGGGSAGPPDLPAPPAQPGSNALDRERPVVAHQRSGRNRPANGGGGGGGGGGRSASASGGGGGGGGAGGNGGAAGAAPAGPPAAARSASTSTAPPST